MGIRLEQGDITGAEVDAIVNAANPVMLGGGGVDGAIHRAAGPALREACERVEAVDGIRCPTGEARITSAGNLKARYVIHTVGPVYASEQFPEKLLASAYANSLDLALDYQCLSVAFPAISCGIFGYPLAEAAEIAISQCGNGKYESLDIRFYLFGNEIFTIWEEKLSEYLGGT